MVRRIRQKRTSLNKNIRGKLANKSSSLGSSTASSHHFTITRSVRSSSSTGRSTYGSTSTRSSRRRSSSSRSSSSAYSYTHGKMQLPNKKLITVSLKLLAEIKHLQTISTNHIPKMPFSRLVREILQSMENNPDILRMQPAALQGLQVAAEYYITTLLGDSNRCAMHAKRVTVMPPDMKLVMELRRAYDPNMSV